MSDLYGFAGLILILLGWLYELVLALKAGRSNMPLAFSLLYGFGSLLLFLHSWILDDVVFMTLNFGATIIPIVNILLILKSRKETKPKKT